MTADRAASIRARLKQRADATKQDFDLVLTRYGLERLLYRLSISEHAPNFLLKGALLFQLWYGDEHRPTRDADLLGFGTDDVPALVAIFRSVSAIPVDDGIVSAEKLHAISVLGVTNTRMKDFFDLWVLLRDPMLESAEVEQAIEATFARRGTKLPVTLPIGLSETFAKEATKQLQWQAFVKRNRLEAVELAALLLEVRTRLQTWKFPRS